MKSRQVYRVTVAKGSYPFSLGRSRNWNVNVNDENVATISELEGSRGWYFVARHDGLGIALRNTCGEIGVPLDDVKRAAAGYVKECLRARRARSDAAKGGGT